METYLPTEYFKTLTPTQKEALRVLWEPVKYDLFAVEVCMDAENDIFDYNIYIAKEVIFNSFNDDKRKNFTARIIHSYNYHQILFNAIPLHECEVTYENEDIIDELNDDIEIETQEEDSEIEHIINKDDALPLLNATAMRDILFNKRCRYELIFKQETEIYTCYIDEEISYKGKSEMEVLWEALRELL